MSTQQNKPKNNMEYIVHGSKNQIDSSFFTYFGAIFWNECDVSIC